MIAMDETRMRGPLPRKIYLYFMHGNTLDYRKEAFLYANLLTYSDDQAMFLSYREQIVAFTWEQLMKRHITEALKILYKTFLPARGNGRETNESYERYLLFL